MKICYLVNAKSFYFKRWYEYFIKSGHEVHIISGDDSLLDIAPQLPQGVILHYLPEKKLHNKKLSFAYNFFRLPLIICELKRLLREIKPDIIQAHQITPYGYWAAISGFQPFIMTPMGSDVLVFARNMKTYGMVTTYVLKKAALVTGDSLVLNETSIEFGAKREKVHLIQNGVDRRMFNEKVDKSILRSRLSLGDGPIILSTRTLSPLYNIDCIIKAMALILKRFPKAKLVLLYFSFALEEDLKLLAKHLGVETAVVFVGQVKYDEMPYYHAGADVSVSVPSSDSSPCSVYESMASGTPSVVSDLPWTKHFIRDGQNALVASLRDPSAIANAVIRIISEKDLNEKLSENGIATARQYIDYETNMRKMAELMADLVKNSLRRGVQ